MNSDVALGAKRIRFAIAGATGMVGGYALRYMLNLPSVERVSAIVRREPGVPDARLKKVLIRDFSNCSEVAQELSGQNAAVFCLGAYTGAVSDEELRRVTMEYTVEFARVFRTASPDASFSFLSGAGADQTGKSRMAFARYKGEAEKALIALGFPRLYIFRPAYIYPPQPRKEPSFSYRLLRAVYPVFRMLFPNQVIPADDLARVMVDVVVRSTNRRESLIFENRDIRSMLLNQATK